MTLNYSLSSRDGEEAKNKKKNQQGLRNGGREDDLFGTNTDFSDRRLSQFDEDSEDDDKDDFKGFFKSDVPWDINFAYQLTYTNIKREKEISGNSLMTSLNMELSKNWKVGVSSGYDFVNKGVTFTQFRFQRDLMSWRMDFSWTPFGTNAFWSFFVGIKSSVLSDIKWEKRTIPDRVLR
jgi:hypothetical protein